MSNALLVIDIQNYFLNKPYIKRDLSRLFDNINALIRFFEANHDPVFHILTVHKADKSTWDLGMLKSGKAVLIEGTDEAKEHARVLVSASHRVVVKTRLSAFIRTGLEEELRRLGIDTVTICGAYTHGCVGRTAIDARELDFNVIIARQAVFSHRKELARRMLKQLKKAFNVSLLSNAEITGKTGGMRADLHVTKAARGLYLSGRIRSESDLSCLVERGIGAIIDLTEDPAVKPPEPVSYFNIPVADGIHIPSSRLGEIYSLIRENIQRAGVLVCCSAGVSRSAGIALGFLMLTHKGWTWERAFGCLNKKRFIWPALEIRESVITYLRDCGLREERRGGAGPDIDAGDASVLRELEYSIGVKLPETGAINWNTRGYAVRDGRVTGLGLYQSGLDAIPEAVFKLPYLSDLYLYGNRVSLIPAHIGNLRQLKRLGLSGNRLKELPPEIGTLKSLEFLNVGHNRMETIPETIGELENLAELYMNNNEIGRIPAGLCRLKKLSGLYLGHNRLNGLPPEFSGLAGLKYLGLESNGIPSLPECIVQIRALTAINLHHNNLACLPEGIGRLKSLDSLNLGDNSILRLPASITRLRALRRLNLGLNGDLSLSVAQNEWIERLRKRGCMVITE